MKRILIVEDIDFNRDLLVQLLEDNYEILTAPDGATGIATAEREHPDLIIMDLSLPGIDGWEATRRIKADATLAAYPDHRLVLACDAGGRGKSPAGWMR